MISLPCCMLYMFCMIEIEKCSLSKFTIFLYNFVGNFYRIEVTVQCYEF